MNTLGILSLTITVALGACAGARAAGPTPLPTHEIFSETTSPQHVTAKWGRYRVRVTGGWFDDGFVTIGIDNQPILRQVAGEPLEVFTERLEPSGETDLVAYLGNGSNIYGCHTTYVFTQNGGLREMASITGGGGVFEQLGSRILFVMGYTGVLESGDYCHACAPVMPLVFDWNNGNPINSTARYSWLTLDNAEEQKASILADLRQPYRGNGTMPVYSDATGYYGNEYELGRGREAYRWIMRRLPTSAMRAEFADDARDARRQIAQIPKMVSHSQAQVLTVPEDDVFDVAQ